MGRPKICIFAKPIQDLTYEQTADFLAKHPVDGLEATVRTGGHAAPKLLDQGIAAKGRDVDTLDKWPNRSFSISIG
ncbi:MAG: hypothetical protein NTY15_05735 [Planctomycetota bacterium]|nr:hypothetical protein [Planctomycetota bacterium]